MKKTWLVCLFALLVGISCVGHLVWIRTLNYEDIAKKYPPGTPAKQVVRDLWPMAKLVRTGVILQDGASEDEKRRAAETSARLPWARTEIDFNFYGQVLRVAPIVY